MKDNTIKLFIGYILLAAALIGCAMMFSSCKLTRDVQKSSSDSTQVKKEETLFTKIDTSKSTKEADRVTFIYPVDTTVNKYYTYPTKVIYEKVKETKQDGQSLNYENRKTDTVYVKTEEKQVEAKAGTDTVLIALLVFGGIVGLIIVLIILRLLKKWEIL